MISKIKITQSCIPGNISVTRSALVKIHRKRFLVCPMLGALGDDGEAPMPFNCWKRKEESPFLVRIEGSWMMTQT
jgi:hypothetical protein